MPRLGGYCIYSCCLLSLRLVFEGLALCCVSMNRTAGTLLALWHFIQVLLYKTLMRFLCYAFTVQAVALLQHMDWNRQAKMAFVGITMVVDHLLRLPLCAESEGT